MDIISPLAAREGSKLKKLFSETFTNPGKMSVAVRDQDRLYAGFLVTSVT